MLSLCLKEKNILTNVATKISYLMLQIYKSIKLTAVQFVLFHKLALFFSIL